MNNNRQ